MILKVMRSNRFRGCIHVYLNHAEDSNRTAPAKECDGSVATMDELVKSAQAKVASEPSYERMKDALSYMKAVIKITHPLSQIGVRSAYSYPPRNLVRYVSHSGSRGEDGS